MPYSELIRTGSNFKMTRKQVGAKTFSHVWIQHPKDKEATLHLIFDKNSRLIEWDRINDLYSEKKDSVHEKRLLYDYKSYRDSSGELIWWPYRATFSYIMGTLPDGKLVERRSVTVDIEKIKFNVDISDDKFVIDFPPDAAIYDGLNHHGWIKAKEFNDPSAAPVLTSVSRWRLIIVAVIVLMLVSITVGIVLYKRRSRRRSPA